MGRLCSLNELCSYLLMKFTGKPLRWSFYRENKKSRVMGFGPYIMNIVLLPFRPSLSIKIVELFIARRIRKNFVSFLSKIKIDLMDGITYINEILSKELKIYSYSISHAKTGLTVGETMLNKFLFFTNC